MQLQGGLLTLAQSQFGCKPKVYHAYGILVRGLHFSFYEGIVPNRYLRDLADGIRPRDEFLMKRLVIHDQKQFALNDHNDSVNIFELFNHIL